MAGRKTARRPWRLWSTRPETALAALAVLLGSVATGSWRATGVGSPIQVPMFYDDHYLYPRPWTQAQEAPGVPAPLPLAFYGPNSVGQAFVGGAPNLAVVEVWLAGSPTTEVIARLSADDGRAWQANLFLRRGTAGGLYRLAVPPIADAVDRRFLLELRAPAATAEAPVVTRSVGQDQLDSGIRVNEFIRPGNLALATYSRGAPGGWWVAALGEQLLPRLYRLRLQQYKPPPLKGALVPWLMAVSAFLTALFLYLARPYAGARPSPLPGLVVLSVVAFLLWQLSSGRLHFPPVSGYIPMQTVVAASREISVEEPRVTHDLVQMLWIAERRPEERLIHTEQTPWPAIRVPAASRVAYPLVVSRNARLRLGLQTVGDGSLGFQVALNNEPLASLHLAAGDPVRWLTLDLGPWQGQSGVLTFVTGDAAGAVAGRWLMPQIMATTDWVLPATLPDGLSAQTLNYRLGESVTLVGYDVAAMPGSADSTLQVTLYWRARQAVSANATVFVHARDGDGTLLSQNDGPPLQGAYPTTFWPPGVIVEDKRVLAIPEDGVGEVVDIAVGLYDPASLSRWSVADGQGNLVPENQIVLPVRP